MGCQCHTQVLLLSPTPPQERDLVPMAQLDCVGPRSGWVQKISPPAGFHPRIIQPTASPYTDYTIQAHKNKKVPKLI